MNDLFKNVEAGPPDVFARQGYGNRLGFGKSPALLLVDFVNGFMDEALFGSPQITFAMQRSRVLLEAARKAALPIAYTRIVFARDRSDVGLMAVKVPTSTLLHDGNPVSAIVDDLRPQAGDIVIQKRYPSAFFGTDLASLLIARGTDTLLVAGCSTSGCVHASVVDAMSFGFRPLVISDCVGDRDDGCHRAALLNMDMKYADVVTSEAAIRRIHELFPKGGA